MKNIAFTICSNNYLSQAKVLSDSVYEHSSDTYDFYIVLCDVFSDKIDYSEFHAQFVEAKDLGIDNFDWMKKHYNIIELNTAIKPFAFKFLIDQSSPEYIHYLDPDTCTYCSLTEIEKEMGDASILLTPHTLAPLPFDGSSPTDNTFLNNGIYNLGFLGLKVSDESFKMIRWWSDFLKEHCLVDYQHGYFVDQLPMELVPLYFDKVKVSKHKGLNVAYWNLHERILTLNNEKYWIDNIYPLVFFHFSSYKMSTPQNISGRPSRINLADSPVLSSLFEEYYNKRIKTKDNVYRTIGCEYTKRRESVFRSFLRNASAVLKIGADIIYYKVRSV